ncbi:methyltransferase domain-containing protein [Brachybacterium tyrofermentans]|uniref:class I SAM-dependent methyltransferase n=1 Tax=Brachybacterium tyrofermentans TaxID=47848 RepID=UPI003F91F57B
MANPEPRSDTDANAGPDYVDYLITKRAAVAPAVAAAIDGIDLPDQRRAPRILDAGTGAGGAVPDLVRLLGPADGTIVPVDVDPRAVDLARGHCGDPRVEVRLGDLREIAAAPSAHGGPFDLIFASDVIWPVTFPDPGEVVAELAGALRPGGVLALYTDNYYQSMFLPGHSRLERLIRTASELTWGLPDDGSTHYERLGAWMDDAGLSDVTVRVLPLSAAVSQPEARAYLETAVWPEMSHAVTANGQAVGMSDGGIARAHALLDPASPDWVGADPHGYVVQPTLLWTGRVPDGLSDRAGSESA